MKPYWTIIHPGAMSSGTKATGFGLRKIQVQVQILPFTIYVNFNGSIFLLGTLETKTNPKGPPPQAHVGSTEIQKSRLGVMRNMLRSNGG